MKIHISSKLTQYLINIFKMRFLMRKCLKYAQQCKNKFFKKHVGQQRYAIQLCKSPLNIGSIANPIIPYADKHALWPFYSLNLKIGMQMLI